MLMVEASAAVEVTHRDSLIPHGAPDGGALAQAPSDHGGNRSVPHLFARIRDWLSAVAASDDCLRRRGLMWEP